MSYTDSIGRADLSAKIPEEVQQEVVYGARDKSFVMSNFKNVVVRTNQTRVPVLSALPTAYWVDGDTGLIETTEAAWANKYIYIEKLAAIVPIPEDVAADAVNQNIWDDVIPLLQEAAAILIDTTVLVDSSAGPSSFPDSVVAAATAASHTVSIGTHTADEGGIIGDHSDLLAFVEDDGFSPQSGIASPRLRAAARQARSTTGDRLAEIGWDKQSVDIDGIVYDTNTCAGQWTTTTGDPAAVVIDPSQFAVGLRKDLTLKVLDQAVIQDGSGTIQYNLAQQDMVGMKMTMRVGWQVANTITRENTNEATRYPGAVLLNA